MDKVLELLRLTKFRHNNYRRVASGGGKCYTMTLGITGLGSRTWDSKKNKGNEELWKLLKEIAGDFKFTSITINKNFESKPHLDTNNIGDSMIFSIGNYTGGRLVINGIYYDTFEKMVIFDGSKELHWTEPFSGERYTIIYFNRV